MEMTAERWERIREYLAAVFGQEDPEFSDLTQCAAEAGLPNMSVGPEVGRLLMILTSLTGGGQGAESAVLGAGDSSASSPSQDTPNSPKPPSRRPGWPQRWRCADKEVSKRSPIWPRNAAPTAWIWSSWMRRRSSTRNTLRWRGPCFGRGDS